MKCPKISTPDHPVECYEKDCAIWDKENERCVERSQLETLREINYYLYELVKKMPHELQFRK